MFGTQLEIGFKSEAIYAIISSSMGREWFRPEVTFMTVFEFDCRLCWFPGRLRLRHTRGTTPRCCWWETNVTWMTSELWAETEAGSCLSTSVSSHTCLHTCNSLVSTQTWRQSTTGALISFKKLYYVAGSCVLSLTNSGGTNQWVTTTGCTKLTRKRASVLEETWERFSHNITCFQTWMRTELWLRTADVSER